MNNLSRRSGAVCLGLAFLPTVALAQLPTYSLLAVKINPECVGGANAGAACLLDSDCSSNNCGGDIAPSANISAFPGDLIEVEVFASNWSPDGQQLRNYQVAIDRDSFTSGTAGELMLLDAPRPCTVGGTECDDLGSTVDCVEGFCELPPLGPPNPDAVILDTGRPDYIFFGLTGTFAVVDTEIGRVAATRTDDNGPLFGNYCHTGGNPSGVPCNTTTDCTNVDPNLGPCFQYNPNLVPKYAGTFRFVASEDACGLFRILILPPTDSTLSDQDNLPIAPINLEELVIDLGFCECRIVESDPDNCSLDARQPSEPDGTGVATARFVDYKFNDGCLLSTVLVSQFSAGPSVDVFFLNRNPPGRPDQWIRPLFAGGLSMPLAEWTCITYDPPTTPDQVFCYNRLPADVNQNGTSRVLDLRRMTDVCLPLGFCDLLECDADRSGRCTPRDLLRVADLLNGAAMYDVWELENVLPCSSP